MFVELVVAPLIPNIGSTNDGVEMVIGIGKTVSEVNHP